MRDLEIKQQVAFEIDEGYEFISPYHDVDRFSALQMLHELYIEGTFDIDRVLGHAASLCDTQDEYDSFVSMLEN